MIILSYERNLKQKEELLKRKEEEFEKSESAMFRLNEQLSSALDSIIKLDESINSNKNIHANQNFELEKIERLIMKKNQESNVLNVEIEILGKKIAHKNVEKIGLEETLKEQDFEIKKLRMDERNYEQEISKIEGQLREIINNKVHDQIDRLFKEKKLSIYSSKMNL